MPHGVELLCSVVVVAFARLLRYVLSIKVLMSLCSPRLALQLVIAPPAPTARTIKRQDVAAAAVAMAVDERSSSQSADQHSQQPPLLRPPASHELVLDPAFKGEGGLLLAEGKATATAVKSKAKAGRGRPSRLVIPPPVVSRAGINPFGDAAGAGQETDVAATEVEARGEGFCVASRRGVRHAMEDAYGVITDKIGGDSQMAFYGVYDGHGGRAAVDLVADKLGKNILAALSSAAATTAPSRRDKQPGLPSSSSSTSWREDDDHLGVIAAIRAGYLTTDSEFLSQGARGGACAATALVKDGELYVANVGDCRAVLGTHGGVATSLTSDHTPGREDERLRIENSGGYVSRGSGGVWRVQDSLAVSRAFGDADMRPWVTCEPEVARRLLTPECAFVVLASDGLWSKVSNQEAVDAVTRSGTNTNTGPSVDSCKELVAMARSRGSRDDITVMVVDVQRFLR